MRTRRLERAPQEMVNNLPWVRWGEEGEKLPDAAQQSARETSQDLEAAEPAHTMSSVKRRLRNMASNVRERLPFPAASATSANASAEPSTAPLPFSVVAQQRFFDTQKECAICLGEFLVGEAVRCLPCQHLLHAACVDPVRLHALYLLTRALNVGVVAIAD